MFSSSSSFSCRLLKRKGLISHSWGCLAAISDIRRWAGVGIVDLRKLQALDLRLHALELYSHLVTLLGAPLQLLKDVVDHCCNTLDLLSRIVSRGGCRIVLRNRMLREVWFKLGVRSDKLGDARQFEKILGQASDRIDDTFELLAWLLICSRLLVFSSHISKCGITAIDLWTARCWRLSGLL